MKTTNKHFNQVGGPIMAGTMIVLILVQSARADTTQCIMDKPHPVFGVPMGVVLLVFVAIAALKGK